MFKASKRLQAIRRQLKEMDEHYRQNSDSIHEQSEETTTLVPNVNLTTASQCYGVSKSNGICSLPVDASPGQTPLASVSEGDDPTSVLQTDTMLEDALVVLSDASNDKGATLPLSEELRCAISSIEDLDDVDNLIGDVLCSLPVNSSQDEDLLSLDESFTRPDESVCDGTESGLTNIQLQSLQDASNNNNVFLSQRDEMKWRKDRQRKDKHNKIERRRRYNINDRINELANLLPPTTHPEMKLNKGSILKAAVAYIKNLKKDVSHLRQLEAKQSRMESKHQKMIMRIFQLEIKMKLYGLSQEMEQSKSKKKRPNKNCLKEIDNIVNKLFEEGIPRKSKEKRMTTNCETKITNQKKKTFINKGLQSLLRSPVHRNMKNHSGKDTHFPYTITRDDTQCAVNNHKMQKKHRSEVKNAESANTATQSHSQNNDTSQSEIKTEDQNGQILDFLNMENLKDITIFPSGEESSDHEECSAPVSPTTSMLENLLRNSCLNPYSDSTGIDSSLESSSNML